MPAASRRRAPGKPSGVTFIVGMTNSAPSLMPAASPQARTGKTVRRHFIVGMTNSAPSLMPEAAGGDRLGLGQNLIESVPAG